LSCNKTIPGGASVFDAVATFATIAGFTLAFFEWRRAKKEEALRRAAEQRSQSTVDQRIGSEALGVVAQIEELLDNWSHTYDRLRELRIIATPLQRVAAQAN
jgi:hypothetical protein